MRYVVHGATGAQGQPVLAALRAAGKPVVAATSKTVSDLPDVPTINVDYGSSERLAEIYRGSAGVFVQLPVAMPGTRRAFAESIGAALAAARPARVVISTSGKIIDRPGENMQEADDAGLPHLISLVREAGLSYAVVAPMNFFENLLLPPVQQSIFAEGVLPYPLRDDIRVSWASHLDVADAVVALFERPDIYDLVGVGHETGLTGPDLAAAFTTHLGRSVAYEALEPTRFGQHLTPLMGEGPAMTVAAHYQRINARPAHVIDASTSAQRRLDLTPRSLVGWLAEISLKSNSAEDAQGNAA